MDAPTVADRDRARHMLGRLEAGATLTSADGDRLELPPLVATALSELLAGVADGDRPVVLRSADEVTTGQAAIILGLSPPAVDRLVDAGDLHARGVGHDGRLALRDVVAHRAAAPEQRRRAVDRMVREAEALGPYD